MNKIELKNIKLSYGSNVIINDFSIDISEGEIIGIVGPSGCGKTTLMRALCGLKNPDQGEIYVNGIPYFSKAQHVNIPPENRNIGIVFQDYAVWPHLTVEENVAYPLKKRKKPTAEIKESVHHALTQVSMLGYEKYMPSQLSGGQQQRVAIARALTSSKDIIIMDEPITNLDAKLREGMLVEIRLMQQRLGSTIIYVTHDQEAALQLCDRVVIMDNKGNISQIGTDEDIIGNPANRFVFKFIGVSNFIPVCKKKDGYYLHLDNDYLYSKSEPKGWIEGEAEMGIRPMDIIFDPKGLVEAVITQGVFLGDMYNYFITIGDREYRVQRSTLDSLDGHDYKVGEKIHVSFLNEKYYPTEAE
ncbi:MAG: ABC transporter ATP-binding protein [Sphaerochaetaceae bacterium]|nr:ABC transporter ATP-binding protein [Sphaerochaetaceae bacterium]